MDPSASHLLVSISVIIALLASPVRCNPEIVDQSNHHHQDAATDYIIQSRDERQLAQQLDQLINMNQLQSMLAKFLPPNLLNSISQTRLFSSAANDQTYSEPISTQESGPADSGWAQALPGQPVPSAKQDGLYSGQLQQVPHGPMMLQGVPSLPLSRPASSHSIGSSLSQQLGQIDLHQFLPVFAQLITLWPTINKLMKSMRSPTIDSTGDTRRNFYSLQQPSDNYPMESPSMMANLVGGSGTNRWAGPLSIIGNLLLRARNKRSIARQERQRRSIDDREEVMHLEDNTLDETNNNQLGERDHHHHHHQQHHQQQQQQATRDPVLAYRRRQGRAHSLKRRDTNGGGHYFGKSRATSEFEIETVREEDRDEIMRKNLPESQEALLQANRQALGASQQFDTTPDSHDGRPAEWRLVQTAASESGQQHQQQFILSQAPYVRSESDSAPVKSRSRWSRDYQDQLTVAGSQPTSQFQPVRLLAPESDTTSKNKGNDIALQQQQTGMAANAQTQPDMASSNNSKKLLTVNYMDNEQKIGLRGNNFNDAPTSLVSTVAGKDMEVVKQYLRQQQQQRQQQERIDKSKPFTDSINQQVAATDDHSRNDYDYNDEMIANYLSCSGIMSQHDHCFERLSCLFGSTEDPTSNIMAPLERDVTSIVMYSIMRNQLIDHKFKDRLRRAAKVGQSALDIQQCHMLYPCAKPTITQSIP